MQYYSTFDDMEFGKVCWHTTIEEELMRMQNWHAIMRVSLKVCPSPATFKNRVQKDLSTSRFKPNSATNVMVWLCHQLCNQWDDILEEEREK